MRQTGCQLQVYHESHKNSAVPLTLLKKSSSGAHFFVARHYARNSFASTDKQPCFVRSSHAEGNAQTQVPLLEIPIKLCGTERTSSRRISAPASCPESCEAGVSTERLSRYTKCTRCLQFGHKNQRGASTRGAAKHMIL